MPKDPDPDVLVVDVPPKGLPGLQSSSVADEGLDHGDVDVVEELKELVVLTILATVHSLILLCALLLAFALFLVSSLYLHLHFMSIYFRSGVRICMCSCVCCLTCVYLAA